MNKKELKKELGFYKELSEMADETITTYEERLDRQEKKIEKLEKYLERSFKARKRLLNKLESSLNNQKKVSCYNCGKEITKEQANYMRVKEDPKPGSVRAPFCDECFKPYQD